jgi:hypothetical protein
VGGGRRRETGEGWTEKKGTRRGRDEVLAGGASTRKQRRLRWGRRRALVASPSTQVRTHEHRRSEKTLRGDVLTFGGTLVAFAGNFSNSNS